MTRQYWPNLENWRFYGIKLGRKNLTDVYSLIQIIRRIISNDNSNIWIELIQRVQKIDQAVVTHECFCNNCHHIAKSVTFSICQNWHFSSLDCYRERNFFLEIVIYNHLEIDHISEWASIIIKGPFLRFLSILNRLRAGHFFWELVIFLRWKSLLSCIESFPKLN